MRLAVEAKPRVLNPKVASFRGRIGRTSIKIGLEVWTEPFMQRPKNKVAGGVFIYVAVNSPGRPIPLALAESSSNSPSD